MGNNSTPLNKKLKSYSALAGTLITAGATTADAQVMYTDVSPDVVIDSLTGPYGLDLDNNAVIDFGLQISHGTYIYGTVAVIYDYGLASQQVVGNLTDTAATGDTRAHVINDPINASLLWDNAATYGLLSLVFQPPFTAYNSGNFIGATDKYIGFKFKISGADHYGWARISINAASTQMTLKDYGYDATPNTQILCGAMPTGISNVSLEASTQIFATDNSINVKLINHSSVDGFVFISDVLGHVVVKVSLTNETTVIPMNTTSGIYFATVNKADGSTFTKKLFVK